MKTTFLFGASQAFVIQYCAAEVDRQHRGPLQVVSMLEAWDYAVGCKLGGRRMSDVLIEEIGRKVEPEKNARGFRRCEVMVGSHRCPPARELPERIERYLLHVPSMSADDAYREFEEIHPFVDGNGRAGKVIYNYLLDTLHTPKMPPNFWNCSNP